MSKIAGLVFLLLISTIFYFRINFITLYQQFGFYQGDIWYFYTFYGDKIKDDFFYRIEYPVGYVLIQKLSYFLTINIYKEFNYQNFMLSHLVLILPTALACYFFFLKIFKHLNLKQNKQFLLFVFSPSLAIYSTINYDLFPMTFVLGAIYFLFKQEFKLSFLFLSLGTVIKIYPLFLIPIFIFYMLSKKIKSLEIIKSIFVFSAIFLIINLPYYLFNKSFWIYPYIYQTQNPEKSDPTTISYFLFQTLNLGFLRTPFLILLIVTAWFISYKFFNKKILSNKNLIYLCLLTLFSSVFGNQVYTPQYIMWFLPYILLTSIIPLFIWFPFDLLNAATRFFYFKLKTDYLQLFYIIWYFSVFYYLILYLLLINFAKNKLNEKI